MPDLMVFMNCCPLVSDCPAVCAVVPIDLTDSSVVFISFVAFSAPLPIPNASLKVAIIPPGLANLPASFM